MRFFTGVNLTLDCTPTIWCANQQTVGIVSKEHDKLHTKVKHVDIHQLWIRQEVGASWLRVLLITWFNYCYHTFLLHTHI
jgi:hypothetical protein